MVNSHTVVHTFRQDPEALASELLENLEEMLLTVVGGPINTWA